jgi:hypothetical protein
MPDQPIDPLQEHETQHIIVLQLLREEHPQHWTRSELQAELDDISPDAIAVAIERLHEQGVVHVDGEQLRACACARHLDTLGFISV